MGVQYTIRLAEKQSEKDVIEKMIKFFEENVKTVEK